MAFDLATAKPAGGFDLASARPVDETPPPKMLGVPEPIGVYRKPIPTPDLSSPWEKVKGGMEAALASGSSAILGLAAPLIGVKETLASGKYGTQEGVRSGEDAATKFLQQYAYAPRGEKGQEYTADIGDAASNMIPLVGLPNELSMIGRVTKHQMPIAQATKQATLSKAGEAVGSIVDPMVAQHARVGIEKGMPINLHQLFDSKIGQLVGGFFDKDIPAAGGNSQKRVVNFTRAFVDEIGGDPSSGKITGKPYAQAMDKAGAIVSDIYKKTDVPDIAPMLKAGASIIDDAAGLEGVPKRLEAKLAGLQKYSKNGGISGADFHDWRSKLLEDIRKTSDGSLKHALEEFDRQILKEFTPYISAADRPAWDLNRYRYAIGKEIEPAVAKAQSNKGWLNPSDVNNAIVSRGRFSAISRGEGGVTADLAAIGKQFVEDPRVPTNIIERNLGYRALAGITAGGGLGYAATTVPGVGPALAGAAGGAYLLANAYNRLGPKLARFLVKEQEKASWPKSAPPLLLEYNPSLIPGFEGVRAGASPAKAGVFGDPTPEWTTSLGAGKEPPPSISGAGLFPSFDDPRVGTTRLKGRPQMPAAEGLPGLADTAIAGKGGIWQYGEPWVDATVSVGPEQSRLAAAPMAVGGIELSRLINMPKSAKRTKLLNEFKARYPNAAEYIDQNM